MFTRHIHGLGTFDVDSGTFVEREAFDVVVMRKFQSVHVLGAIGPVRLPVNQETHKFCFDGRGEQSRVVHRGIVVKCYARCYLSI